jgi:hypothetical protein
MANWKILVGNTRGNTLYNTAKQAAKEYDAAAIERGRALSKLNLPKWTTI